MGLRSGPSDAGTASACPAVPRRERPPQSVSAATLCKKPALEDDVGAEVERLGVEMMDKDTWASACVILMLMLLLLLLLLRV